MYKLSGDCVVRLGHFDFQAILLDTDYLYGKLLSPKKVVFARTHHWQSAGYEVIEALPTEPPEHLVKLPSRVDLTSYLREQIRDITKFSELDNLKLAARKSSGKGPATYEYTDEQLDDFCHKVVSGCAPYDRLSYTSTMGRVLAEWAKYLSAQDRPWEVLDPWVSQEIAEMSTSTSSKKELYQALKGLGLEIGTTDLNFVSHQRPRMTNLTEVAVQLMSQLNQPQ